MTVIASDAAGVGFTSGLTLRVACGAPWRGSSAGVVVCGGGAPRDCVRDEGEGRPQRLSSGRPQRAAQRALPQSAQGGYEAIRSVDQ
eukprot:1182459-Prorocentrum_minimum.AAC.1